MTDTANIDESGLSRTNRRDLLKKAAVAGAVAWAAPVVTTSRAFAAATVGQNLCCDPVKGKGKVASVTYRYFPGPCTGNNEFCGQVTDDPKYSCTGSTSNPANRQVQIRIRAQGSGTVLQTFNLDLDAVPKVDTFTMTVTTNDMAIDIRTPNGVTLLQTVNYHYSCSAPLCAGDQHGPLTVVTASIIPGSGNASPTNPYVNCFTGTKWECKLQSECTSGGGCKKDEILCPPGTKNAGKCKKKLADCN